MNNNISEILPEINFSKSFDFKPKADYDPNNNYLFAQFCGLTYKSSVEIDQQIRHWNASRTRSLIHHELVDMDSFRYVLLHCDDWMIIAFRGSDNFMNWVTDFNMWLVPFQGGKGLIHKGFYDSVKLMEESIDKLVSKHRDNNQPIYITGHSLGGAQASIAAFVCKELNGFHYISTFGEPKICNEQLANYFNGFLNSSSPSGKSRIFRQLNGWDPVPTVPPGFSHEGEFYLYCSSPGDYYTTQLQLRGLEEEEELSYMYLNRHSIELYVDNAFANKSKSPF